MRGILAHRPQAIMATCAIADDAGVTERRWFPRRRGVAAIAFLRGWNMPGRLAGGAHTVVTGRAGFCDSGVIKARCGPAQRGMAGTAIETGLNVSNRLADGGHIIVATGA